MEELGRAEVILDGAGRLEEAQELVDVRLEVVDLVWNWESQGLVAEGAVRTYIYYQKEDGTIEGEGVEIPFHGVVLPPGSPSQEVRVRLEDVREEHQFEPKDRSFTQSIHLRLVAEQPARTRSSEEVSPETPRAPEPVGTGPYQEPAPVPTASTEGVARLPHEVPPAEKPTSPAPEPQPVEPVAGETPDAQPVEAGGEAPETLPVKRAPLEQPEAMPAYPGAAGGGTNGAGPEDEETSPEPPQPAQDLPTRETEVAPLVAAHVAQGPTGAGPGLHSTEPRPELPTADETVIVWKPFPDE